MKGKFIVIEGIDGSGSSSQAKLIHDYIIEKKGKCILTSEPSDGPVGNLIKQILHGRLNIHSKQYIREAELSYLFAADRFDHLYNEQNGVMTLLQQGIDVVCTRYFPSSYAYHCFDNNFEMVHSLNKNFPPPDVLFYLDVDIEVSIERIKRSRKADINENIDNLRRVKKNYEKFFENYQFEVERIDANNDPIDIFADLLNILETKLNS